MASVDIMRILQLVASVLGLTFSILSVPQLMVLVVGFAVATVYMIIIMVVSMTGRAILSSSAHAILELVLGIVLLVFAIYAVSCCFTSNVMFIVTIVTAFVLPALFFITAYERM